MRLVILLLALISTLKSITFFSMQLSFIWEVLNSFFPLEEKEKCGRNLEKQDYSDHEGTSLHHPGHNQCLKREKYYV